MNKLFALGLVTLGGVIALRLLPQELRPPPGGCREALDGQTHGANDGEPSCKLSAQACHDRSAKAASAKRTNHRSVTGTERTSSATAACRFKMNGRCARSTVRTHLFKAERAPPKRLKISLLR